MEGYKFLSMVLVVALLITSPLIYARNSLVNDNDQSVITIKVALYEGIGD